MLLRLLLSFIFFGLLFYAIWLYAPDTFQLLTSWAAKALDWLNGLVEQLTGLVKHKTPPPPTGKT